MRLIVKFLDAIILLLLLLFCSYLLFYASEVLLIAVNSKIHFVSINDVTFHLVGFEHFLLLIFHICDSLKFILISLGSHIDRFENIRVASWSFFFKMVVNFEGTVCPHERWIGWLMIVTRYGSSIESISNMLLVTTRSSSPSTSCLWRSYSSTVVLVDWIKEPLRFLIINISTFDLF